MAEIPPLTEVETDNAIKDLVVKNYPTVLRNDQDKQIPGQQFPLLSFFYFDEPKTGSNGEKVFGMFKIRGSYSTEVEADAGARKIIKEVDSKNKIYFGRQGSWMPLAKTGYVESAEVVDGDGKTYIEGVGFGDEQAKKIEFEQQQFIREIKEKERKLREEDLLDVEGLHGFCTKMNIFFLLHEEIVLREKTIQKMKAKEEKNLRLLSKILEEKPEFKEHWLEYYNKVRKEQGHPPCVPRNSYLEELWKFGEDHKDELKNKSIKDLENDLARC